MLWLYLRKPSTLTAVVGPWIVVIYWMWKEAFRSKVPAKLLWTWMLCVIGSYFLSEWQVTDDLRELHIINVFFIFEAFYLYFENELSVGTAFSLAFLADWLVDMTRAAELIRMGVETTNTYYFGVGGAGMFDGLYIFSMVAALLVPYVKYRQASAKKSRIRRTLEGTHLGATGSVMLGRG